MKLCWIKTVLMTVLAAGRGVLAAAYYDWTGEYDGTSSNTIALYHFNAADIYTNGATVYAAVAPDRTGSNWDAGYTKAAATCLFTTNGKFGGGLSVPGGSDVAAKCSVASSTNLFPSGADPSLSVECHVQFNDTSSRQFLVSKGTAWSSIGGYDLWYDNGVLKWALGNGTAVKLTTAAWTPAAGQWYHIAGTWDASNDIAKLHVDGNELGSTNFPGLSIVDDSRYGVALGDRTVSAYAALNGTIDEVRISSTAYDYAVLTSHPRLFFTSSDVEELAARRVTTHSNEWAQLIATCNSLKGKVPPTDPRNDANILGREDQLVALALVQLIDPSLSYQATSTNWFWTILNWTEWGAGYWDYPDYGPNGNLGTGEVLKGLAVWYDLQYQNLTPAQRDEVSRKLSDYADRYRNSYERFWTTDNGELTGNHCWNAFAAVAAVLYGADNLSAARVTDWSNLLNGHYNTMTNLMNTVMSDGVTGEGATYWTYGVEKVTHWLEMRRRAGYPAFENVSWFTNTGLYGVYMALPGGTDNYGGNARFDDADPDFWGNPYNDLALLAKATRDPAAQWMATEVDHNGSTKLNAYRYIFYDPAVPAANPAAEYNNWKFFENYGFFLWRNSWSNDAAHFAIRSGQHSHGHSKCDDGQFMIYRAGIPYIVNLGYAVPRYTKDSNILLVNGTGQYSDGADWGTVFNDSWPANQNTWGQTLHVLANARARRDGDFFNVLIDPTPMYTNAALSQWRREAVGPGGDLYLLRDTVSAGSSVKFDLLLHACVTAKGTGNTYDEETYSTNNPWAVLSSKRWKIDARNETPEPPNLLVQDLSKNSWSSAIEESWYYPKSANGTLTRRGNTLKRSLTGTSGSSLVAFGFDDLMSGWTLTAWTNSAADGVHVATSNKAVIDVLWPTNGSSCSGSDGWTVSGKMAGRRYAQTTNDEDACYFAREVTFVSNNALLLASATTPVSLHAKIEQAPGGMVPNRITFKADSPATLTVYAPYEPKTVLINDVSTSFHWSAGQLTLNVPAGTNSVIDLVDPDYLVWRDRYFTPAEITAGTAGLDNDTDADGRTNWEEYIADTDPRSGTSFFNTGILAPVTSGPRQISFLSSSNRIYGLQYRTNLMSGAWQQLNGQPGTGAIITLSDTNSRANCFYRVRVSLP